MEYHEKQEPLLYIDQPVFQTPQAWMQKEYQHCSKNEKESAQQNKVINKADVSFKRLPIAGQINYLLSGPEEVPAIRCEIFTDTKKYRGIILNQNEEEIVVRVAGRPHQIIIKQEIQKIRLIGF